MLGNTPPALPIYRRVRSPLAQPPATLNENAPAFTTPSPPPLPTKDFTIPSPVGFLANSDKSNDSSIDDSKPGITLPKINITVSSNQASESSSYNETGLHRRTLSDRIKTTPSSFVRQSRIFSNEDADSIYSSHSVTGRSLLLQNKIQTESLSPEFHPIVTLINAQKLRTYCIGSLQIPGVIGSERVWLEVEAKLSGNELAIWRPLTDEYTLEEGNEFKPKYINLIDAHIEVVSGLQIKIYQDYREDASVAVQFHDKKSFDQWMSAIILSKFEYVKLNEAFTAVLLSSKGSKLLDIHVLLGNKKRFPQYEWCHIRLPEVSTKWIKVYMAVLPGDKGHVGRIEFYPSDKKLQKKNLIAYISDLAGVFNVYPEQSSMIDFNSIMRAAGEIYVNKNYEYLFPHNSDEQLDPRKLIAKNHGVSRSDSNSSLSSLSNQAPNTPKNRSRSSSLHSTSSFFNQSTSLSPKQTNGHTRNRSLSNLGKSPANPSQTPLSHKRTNSSFFKKYTESFVLTNSVYIMPSLHPGVTAVETMIRNFIPIVDAFKLYGRPKRLISDKSDTASMLFGLPSLPHYQYLSNKDAERAFAQNFKIGSNWFEWPEIIAHEIKQLQSSNTKGYRGHGDIAKLYENLDLDYGEITSPVFKFGKFEDDLPSLSDSIEFGGKIETPPPGISSPISFAEDGSPYEPLPKIVV